MKYLIIVYGIISTTCTYGNAIIYQMDIYLIVLIVMVVVTCIVIFKCIAITTYYRIMRCCCKIADNQVELPQP